MADQKEKMLYFCPSCKKNLNYIHSASASDYKSGKIDVPPVKICPDCGTAVIVINKMNTEDFKKHAKTFKKVTSKK